MQTGFALKNDDDPRWRYVRGCGCRMCHAYEQKQQPPKRRPWWLRVFG